MKINSGIDLLGIPLKKNALVVYLLGCVEMTTFYI